LDAGYGVVGVDSNSSRHEQLAADAVVLNATTRFAVDVRPDLAAKRLMIVDRLEEQLDAHFVCVPTEVVGVPTHEFVESVLRQISALGGEPVIIIESTLAPQWLGADVYRDLRIAIAPRRDWFHSPDHTVQSLTRICASDDQTTLSRALAILRTVSRDVVPSQDPVAAVIAKSFENSLWYILFSFVDELADAIPNADLVEALRLAATNWRLPVRFDLEFQVGGYCLPLAAQYLQTATSAGGSLILDAATSANRRVLHAVLDRVLRAPRSRSVLVLGLAYRPDLKITTNSAGVTLISACKAAGLRVFAHDPLFSPTETVSITGAPYLDPLATDADFDCIIVCTPHEQYADERLAVALRRIPTLRRIIESRGTLRDVAREHPNDIDYYCLGTTEW